MLMEMAVMEYETTPNHISSWFEKIPCHRLNFSSEPGESECLSLNLIQSPDSFLGFFIVLELSH